MKRILFSIIILFLFSGIASGTELGAGDGTDYPAAIDTDTSVEVDYPDPLATTARAAVPNDTNAAVIAIETELGINPSGTYDTLKARLDAGDGLYYLKTEIDTKFAELKFTDLADTPAAYDNGKYAKSTADGIVWDTPAGGGASTYLELTDTPANYTGGSLKFVRVNIGETALEFAEEADPTVDSDAKIKAILVDEVIKTGAFTAGKIAKINNASGIIEQGTNTDTDVADAVTKKHSKNTDTQFDFYNALASDHLWSGDKDTQTVGESVVFGDLLYYDWNNGLWQKADADTAGTMPGLRIALETKTTGQVCLMLVKGYIRDDSAFEFAGAMVYTSVTPGAMSSTAPTETGDQIQRVGMAKGADILFFDPSIDVGEIKP